MSHVHIKEISDTFKNLEEAQRAVENAEVIPDEIVAAILKAQAEYTQKRIDERKYALLTGNCPRHKDTETKMLFGGFMGRNGIIEKTFIYCHDCNYYITRSPLAEEIAEFRKNMQILYR